MKILSICYLLAITNLLYAATIYLSLNGWLVAHDPSGMQLMLHLIITTPVTIITSIWFFYLSKTIAYKYTWVINLLGLLIPIMSTQSGVTYYHYDKVGLSISVIISMALIFSFLKTIVQKLHIKRC